MATKQKLSSGKRKRNEENIVLTKEDTNNYMLRSKKIRSDSTQNLIQTSEAQKKVPSKNAAKTTSNMTRTKGSGKSSKLQLLDRIRTEVPTKEYLINEIILATVPGYQPWPGRILDITDQTIVVEFFGTGQM